MRELASRLLVRVISRRDLVKGLTAVGFAAAAASTILRPCDVLASELPMAGATGAAIRDAGEIKTGTGGELMVAQACAAGVEHLFTNPGSFEVGFFDAVVAAGLIDNHVWSDEMVLAERLEGPGQA